MKHIIYCAFVLLIFSACSSSGQKSHNLDVESFGDAIAAAGVQLVDVRTPEEFAEKRIAGARNININASDFEQQMNRLDKTKPLYLYCLSGGRSANATAWALKNGFTEVYNLNGGILAWMNKGKAVEKEKNTSPKGMTEADYLKAINKEKMVLVDFNAVWCGPCKVLKPRVKTVVKNNAQHLELLDLDVDKNPAVAAYMNVSGIPLLILYKQGKEVWRKLGLADEAEIQQAVERAL